MRPTLTIQEVTALLAAVSTEETALHIESKNLMKKNDLEGLGALGIRFMHLTSAKRRLETALAEDTRTQ